MSDEAPRAPQPSIAAEAETATPGPAASTAPTTRIAQAPSRPRPSIEDFLAATRTVERLLATRSAEDLDEVLRARDSIPGYTAELLVSLLPGEGRRKEMGEGVAHRAAAVLERLGSAALPALRQGAFSPAPAVRLEVARLLRLCGVAEGDPTLVALAGDDDPKVAAAAGGTSARV